MKYIFIFNQGLNRYPRIMITVKYVLNKGINEIIFYRGFPTLKGGSGPLKLWDLDHLSSEIRTTDTLRSGPLIIWIRTTYTLGSAPFIL